MKHFDIKQLDWQKMGDLIPAIVQDAQTSAVLMLGYMNPAALQKTLETQQVTFYSRSKNRLWTKGEESGHYLQLVDIVADCDQDTLLVLAHPTGPVCHTGDATCFAKAPQSDWGFIQQLEKLIAERQQSGQSGSYVASLFQAGTRKIAQKVGEEGVEVALAAVDQDEAALCGEAADLVFHLLVLLRARGLNIAQVIEILRVRKNPSPLVGEGAR